MFGAVTSFFSGMISSFVSAHGSSSPLSFTILAPNGQLIEAPKSPFFDFIVGYLMGIDTPLGRRWVHAFSDVYIRLPNEASNQLNYSLLPENTFTGNMQGGHVDFSGRGLEFILTVMLVYINRLEGIDLFEPESIVISERREMRDDIHFNTQAFLNSGVNWGFFNGYYDDAQTMLDEGGLVMLANYIKQAHFRSWTDYGLTLIQTDDQFNEMLTMALNEDGTVSGSGSDYSGNISFTQEGTTQFDPISTNSNTGLVDINETLNSLNPSKMGLGILILILFLTFKK